MYGESENPEKTGYFGKVDKFGRVFGYVFALVWGSSVAWVPYIGSCIARTEFSNAVELLAYLIIPLIIIAVVAIWRKQIMIIFGTIAYSILVAFFAFPFAVFGIALGGFMACSNL